MEGNNNTIGGCAFGHASFNDTERETCYDATETTRDDDGVFTNNNEAKGIVVIDANDDDDEVASRESESAVCWGS